MLTEQKTLALCFTLAKVDAETLIYALTGKLPVVEEDKIGNLLFLDRMKSGALHPGTQRNRG